MNKIQILILYLFFASSTCLLAQPLNSQVKDVIMPPPNAASLGKYGDIPVSYYTGVPNVDIPIYTVKEGSLSLPVSLSYHAGGMKVGEPCSWVGLGWSLQAGGLISRTIIGKPDERADGYFTTGRDLSYGGGVMPQNGYVQPYDLCTGNKDGEPDVFSFSVGGYNGKFYFDKDKDPSTTVYDPNPVFIPQQDLKIDLLWSATNSMSVNGVSLSGVASSISNVFRIAGFILTTTDGTKYEFGTFLGDTAPLTIERTTLPGQFTAGNASSWYLRRVISSDNSNSIVLNYETELYSYQSDRKSVV